MKILILKPSSLGDVVQALPVLRLLKSQNPSNEIYWWVSSDLVELLEGDPDLAGLFVFRRRRWSAPWHWSEAVVSIAQMRAQRFDWIIDLQGLARSGFVAWLGRAKLCVGVEDWREGAPAFYDLPVPRPSQLAHAVDWYLAVAKALGAPIHWDFTWLPPRKEAAASVRRKWNPDCARWILINPGARWANKRWPVEHYIELVRQLAESKPAFSFGILGSGIESDLGAAIGRAVPGKCLDLTGQTSLSEMIEWIRLSELVVTNDTGPMHIAAALAKPVVAMFGPTEPRRTGPYGQVEHALRIELPCAPCLKPRCHFVRPMECLRAISPERVRREVEKRLES